MNTVRHREEIRHEAAAERHRSMGREIPHTTPYVVRGLSWELARYLDTQCFSASAPDSASK